MEEHKPTVRFLIEGTKPNKSGKFPIKLVVYFVKTSKKYGIKEYVTKDEWEKLSKPNLRDQNLKNLRLKLNAIEGKALELISSLHPFSIIAFEDEFFSKKTKQTKSMTSMRHLFEEYIRELVENEQIGSSISYKTTLNSIESFKKSLTIHDITPRFLMSYEDHLIKSGKSHATVGIYMRQLRSVTNRAIADKLMSADNYPFKKYKIPTGKNTKKALSESGLSKLLKYETENPDLRKAVDFWVFSYLCNGINFADIAYLRTDDVDGDFLSYFRKKTKRTKKKDVRPIKVGLSPMAKEIIKRHRNPDTDSSYLFPILQEGMTPTNEKYKIQYFIRWVNIRMETIRQELSIIQPLNTYAARHSFSTTLKRKNVSTSYIMEALGHSSMSVTESYLDSFSDDVKLNYAELLTDL
jgi:integrase/recombinase XerD